MPKVTVLMGTYNRPVYLVDAIRSVVNQDFQDWELIVMNDGGINVRELIEKFNDDRIIYFNFDDNKGFAYRLDQGLGAARGEYIAYLGDDDVYYPHHLQVLVDALDRSETCGVAYSDLWGVAFARDSKGGRYPVTKRLTVTRDFNRDFIWYYNHVLHVAMMHRRDLALQVGGYDPGIKVLIDWSMTRRLAMVTDFRYVHMITGEYTMPLSGSDRISTLERQDKESYQHNMRMIKGLIPQCAKPYVKDVAVIFPVLKFDEQDLTRARNILDDISYPCRVMIMVDPNEIPKDGQEWRDIFNLPNTEAVLLSPGNEVSSYRHAVTRSEAEYVYLITENYTPGIKTRIIKAFEAMREEQCDAVKWNIQAELNSGLDCFMESSKFLDLTSKDHWLNKLSVAVLKGSVPKSWAWDEANEKAQNYAKKHQWDKADETLRRAEEIKTGTPGKHYSITQRFEYLMRQKKPQKAAWLCVDIIAKGYGGNNWMRLGLALQAQGEFKQAARAYNECLAEVGINGDMIRQADCFPLEGRQDTDALRCYYGLSECYLALGMLDHCKMAIDLTIRLHQTYHTVYIIASRLHMAEKDYEKAEKAIQKAGAIHRDKLWFDTVVRFAIETKNLALLENAKRQIGLNEDQTLATQISGLSIAI